MKQYRFFIFAIVSFALAIFSKKVECVTESTIVVCVYFLALFILQEVISINDKLYKK